MSSGRNLVKEHGVRALIGLGTWQQTAFVADFANKSRVPILSLASEIPTWATTHWPFLVNAARSQLAQMKGVAAIIQSWEWRKVNIIYEDINPTETGIALLISSIQDVQSEVADLLPLPPFPRSYNISQKLRGLNNRRCRVFIVHTSISLATEVFAAAKKLRMMEKGFVWITTTSISNHMDSLSASTVAQMQGALGVRSYFSSSGRRFKDFQRRFQAKFGQRYPKQQNLAAGFYALHASDAAWSLAFALEGKPNWKGHETYTTDPNNLVTSARGQELLNSILHSDFKGLAGAFKFVKGKLDPAHSFQIINVVGKSYRELGYWSEGFGFSKGIGKSNIRYNQSMRSLGNVIWAGDSLSVPRGRLTLDTTIKTLKIGVPASATFPEFVKVTYDNQSKPICTGFSIDVFREVTKDQNLKNFPKFDFVPLEGTYDSMLEKVLLQDIDAVVADTAIVSHRYQFVDFSQPYAEWGIQILIYNQKKKSDRFWLFVKPFKPLTWVAIVIINIYNGAVIWWIERSEPADVHGNSRLPFFIEVGTMLLKTFITLFSIHGKAKRNLSLMILAVWLFLALVITQSYTASLTSLLTVERLDPPTIDFDFLQRTRARVGCDADSFVVNYLKEQNFNVVEIKNEDEYPRALQSGEIAAAILEVPYVKLFLAKYCNNLTTSGSTRRIGGFGFAFPKRSPYLSNISKAIISLSENNRLEERERVMLDAYNCSSSLTPFDSHGSLDIQSFMGVIAVSAATSTVALFIFFSHRLFPAKEMQDGQSTQDQECRQAEGGQELRPVLQRDNSVNQQDDKQLEIKRLLSHNLRGGGTSSERAPF